MAIGVLGEEVNPAISKAICDVLGRKLSISDDRWVPSQSYPSTCPKWYDIPTAWLYYQPHPQIWVTADLKSGVYQNML